MLCYAEEIDYGRVKSICNRLRELCVIHATQSREFCPHPRAIEVNNALCLTMQLDQFHLVSSRIFRMGGVHVLPANHNFLLLIRPSMI